MAPISYQPMPPEKTYFVPVRYYLRGRGEPLPYPCNNTKPLVPTVDIIDGIWAENAPILPVWIPCGVW